MSNPRKHFYEFGPFRLDSAERLLWRGEELVPLTPKAVDTLIALLSQPQQVLSKDDLLERVWPDTYVEESNLAQQVSTLRRTLGENAPGQQYIETIPRRGYRFVADVRERWEEPVTRPPLTVSPEIESPALAEAVAGVAPAIEPAPLITALPAPRVRAWRRARYVLLALIPLLLGAGYYFFLRDGASGRARPAHRLAILPFKNLKVDPDTDFLGFSLADAIITKLSYVSSLTVRPSPYIEKYRHREINPREVADELDVDVLLTGTYLKEGDELRINPQLIDIRTTEVIWSEEVNLKYDKLTTLHDRLAREVIKGLRVNLTQNENAQIQRDVPRDREAYEAHLRGVAHYYADDLKEAAEALEQSVDLDPSYAPSWAYLGTVYETMASLQFGGRDGYSRAQAAYDQALALNPEQIEARIFLAALYTNTGRAEEAVPLLRGVLATNPNLAQAHWELAYTYRFGGMLKESIAEGERARQIDAEIRANNSVFNTYFYDGQYDRFLRSLPSGEDSAFITFYRGLGTLYLKDRARAASLFDRAYEINPSLLQAQIGKAMSYAINGQGAQGMALAGHVEQMIDKHGVADAEGIYKVAQAYAMLGERRGALRVLRRAIEGGFFCYPYFTTDSLLDPVRAEAEFPALMEMARARHEEFRRKFFTAP